MCFTTSSKLTTSRLVAPSLLYSDKASTKVVFTLTTAVHAPVSLRSAISILFVITRWQFKILLAGRVAIDVFLQVCQVLIRARICKRLRSPGISSKKSIPPAYVAYSGPVGTTTIFIIGWWKRFSGTDSWAPEKFTNSSSGLVGWMSSYWLAEIFKIFPRPSVNQSPFVYSRYTVWCPFWLAKNYSGCGV